MSQDEIQRWEVSLQYANLLSYRGRPLTNEQGWNAKMRSLIAICHSTQLRGQTPDQWVKVKYKGEKSDCNMLVNSAMGADPWPMSQDEIQRWEVSLQCASLLSYGADPWPMSQNEIQRWEGSLQYASLLSYGGRPLTNESGWNTKVRSLIAICYSTQLQGQTPDQWVRMICKDEKSHCNVLVYSATGADPWPMSQDEMQRWEVSLQCASLLSYRGRPLTNESGWNAKVRSLIAIC